MRKTFVSLLATLLLFGSMGTRASESTIQVSYDALMALSAEERQEAFKVMDPPTLFALSRAHVDRWLAANRARLSASQVALVTAWRNTLTMDRDLDQQVALEERLVCTFWMSDVLAMTLPQSDRSSSRLQDVSSWLRGCVIEGAIDAVFSAERARRPTHLCDEVRPMRAFASAVAGRLAEPDLEQASFIAGTAAYAGLSSPRVGLLRHHQPPTRRTWSPRRHQSIRRCIR